jgi:Cof subfamily protein (haloacid dehalogenase superfamily)
MPSYKWFITDVDGTLLDEANELSSENRAALEHCKARGIPVVLATGRRWTTLKRVIDRLDLHDLVDYVIINNGMVLKNLKTMKLLHHEAFDQSAILGAVNALNALGWDPLALAYEADGGPDVYHRRLSLRNGDFTEKNDGYCVLLNDYEELEGRAVVELILLGTEAELTRAQQAVKGLRSENGVENAVETALIKNTFYADYMLEITPRGVSKLSGARRLGEHLGLDVAEAVAIGDSANDLPLLREAGRAVAMPEAPEHVRAGAHETGIVSETIRRYFP